MLDPRELKGKLLMSDREQEEFKNENKKMFKKEEREKEEEREVGEGNMF